MVIHRDYEKKGITGENIVLVEILCFLVLLTFVFFLKPVAGTSMYLLPDLLLYNMWIPVFVDGCLLLPQVVLCSFVKVNGRLC